jgi:hypothetical protein
MLGHCVFLLCTLEGLVFALCPTVRQVLVLCLLQAAMISDPDQEWWER